MKYGLIGRSLEHSFSKNYFTDKFLELQIDSEYENIEFQTLDDLGSHFENIKSNYNGLNVTIPYKTDIMSLLDEVDPIAAKINAVNCIVLRNGTSKGYNTDYLGFIHSVSPLLSDFYQNAYILGSGGASKAIQYALEECFHIPTTIISRDSRDFSYEFLKSSCISNYSIVINSTPLGMYPDIMSYPDLDYEMLNATHICMDLIYNPEETQFLKKSKERGARILNGYEMLVRQAELSWELWTN